MTQLVTIDHFSLEEIERRINIEIDNRQMKAFGGIARFTEAEKEDYHMEKNVRDAHAPRFKK